MAGFFAPSSGKPAAPPLNAEDEREELRREATEALRLSNMASLRRVVAAAQAALDDVELRDSLGRTLASVAASKGKLEALRFLVAQGADPRAGDAHGLSPLAYAAWKGQNHIVSFLVQTCGCAPEGEADVFGLHPLHKAAGYGNAVVLGLLLDAGASVNLTTAEVTAPPSYRATSKRETALAIATRLGFHGAMRVLLARPDVRIDLADQHGDTPLHWAARRADWRASQLLLSAGADASVLNRAGRSPVDEAGGLLRVALVTGLGRLFPSRLAAWLDPTWRGEG